MKNTKNIIFSILSGCLALSLSLAEAGKKESAKIQISGTIQMVHDTEKVKKDNDDKGVTYLDQAILTISIPISDTGFSIELYGDGRADLSRDAVTGNDYLEDSEDGAGVSVRFERSVSGVPLMLVAGKFNHAYGPLYRPGPSTVHEGVTLFDDGAMGVTAAVELSEAVADKVSSLVLSGSMLSTEEARDRENKVFSDSVRGYNVSLSAEFISGGSLGIGYVKYPDNDRPELNTRREMTTVHGSKMLFGNSTEVWGRYTDNKVSLTKDEESFSLGVNQNINSIVTGYASYESTENDVNGAETEQQIIGAEIQPYTDVNLSIGGEVFREEVSSRDKDEEGFRLFTKIQF